MVPRPNGQSPRAPLTITAAVCAAVILSLAAAPPATAGDSDDKIDTTATGPAVIAFADGQVWRGRLQSLRPELVKFTKRNAVNNAISELKAEKIKAMAFGDDLVVYDPEKKILVSGVTRYKLNKEQELFEPTGKPAGKKAVATPEMAILRMRDGFCAKGFVRSVTSDELHLTLMGKGPKEIKAADVVYIRTPTGIYRYNPADGEFHFRTTAEVCAELRAMQAETDAKAMQEMFKGIATGLDLYLRLEDNQLRKRALDIKERELQTKPRK